MCLIVAIKSGTIFYGNFFPALWVIEAVSLLTLNRSFVPERSWKIHLIISAFCIGIMLLKCPFVHSQLCASAFCIVEVFFCSLSIAHSEKSPILHSALHLCYISAFCNLCSYSTVNWIPQDIWSVYHVISAIWIAIICGGLCVHSQLCTSGSFCLSWSRSHLHLFRFLHSSTLTCPQYLPGLTRIYLTSSCSWDCHCMSMDSCKMQSCNY